LVLGEDECASVWLRGRREPIGGRWELLRPKVVGAVVVAVLASVGGLTALIVVARGGGVVTYRDEVIADVPGGYWRLGETSGRAAADETSTAIGTYRGGVALGAPGAVSGGSETSASFDGVNDTVRVSDEAVLDSRRALTVEAWVRPSRLPRSTSTIVGKGSQYRLLLSSAGAIWFWVWRARVLTELATEPGAVSAGRWAHVAASWDGSEIALYVNGVLRGTAPFTGPVNASSADLYIGSNFGTYDWFAGRVEDVAVYDSALSAPRIFAHFARANMTDKSAPTVLLLTPAAGSSTDARPNFGGVASVAAEDSRTVRVKIFAGSAVRGIPVSVVSTKPHASGTFSVLGPALRSGTYTAQASQANRFGVVGVSAPTSFAVEASADPVILTAGDIAGCDTSGDEATAELLDRLRGVVVPAGDYAYETGSAALFSGCYDPSWGRQKARTRPVIGAHEYNTPGAAGYFGYFGAMAGAPSRGYYSFNLGAWHVLALNSNCGAVSGGCGARSSQVQWLRSDLAAHPSACTVAFMHEPRFSSGSVHGSDPLYEDLWQALYDGGADVVVDGSDHIYERFAPQTPTGQADPAHGIREFTVGTGGRGHYSFATLAANSEVHNNDTFGLLRLTLHRASYDWAFVPEAGKTFADSGTGRCH
jgi:Concanavalin A-like lectin/glucanases superfamily